MHSWDKQQQVMTSLPTAMDAIKVTTNCDGHDPCHHRDASKRLTNKPLKCNKEGCGNQLWSRKQPCRQTQQECCGGVVSITTILIPQWQLLSRSSINCLEHKTNNKTCGVLLKIPLRCIVSQDLSKKHQQARRTCEHQWQNFNQQQQKQHQKLRHQRPPPWQLPS